MSNEKIVELRHTGGMRFEATPSVGYPLTFDSNDTPQGNSPVETVLAALGSCTAMDVISIAVKKRVAVEEYRIHVRGRQRDEYPQVLAEVVVTHEVVGRDISEASIRRCIELSATKYCPVSAMLSAGATVVHHRFRIVSTGAEPYESEGEVLATGPYARPDVLADQR
jgi:putative redox protein